MQPASLAGHATETITFFVPPGDGWSIMVNGSPAFSAEEINSYGPDGCPGELAMEVNADGSSGIGCLD